jgi:hypothetical protein
MAISMKLHPKRVPDERLPEVWQVVYQGYTECWNDVALEHMASVGEEICSALEELAELRETRKAIEQAENEGLPCTNK